ncbi:cytochrome P450 [Lanmaoa asiatica]|nr:cytochrome P450 [Lanmaoa asiatica]
MSVSNWQQLCFAVVLCVVAFDVGYLQLQRKRRALPLPPGPPPLPIAGNIRGINTSSPWLTYTEWANLYGDLVYSSFFNQVIIVINSEKVARALLEQRSNIYSDRPEIPTNALFGLDFNTVLMRYGDRWRLQRRLFHQAFRADAAPRYRPMQQRKSHQLLLAIFEDPEACFEHLHTYSSSIIMSALYDYETKPKNDPMVNVVGRALKLAVEEVRPEVAAFFSVFPFCRFSRFLTKRRAHVPTSVVALFLVSWNGHPHESCTIERVREGTAGPSMVSDAMNRMRANGSDEQLQAIKEVSATAFGGEYVHPSMTYATASTLQVFLLAMILFPEVQKKAQSVIDAMVGTSRLPAWTDRPSLKYIDAVLRETLRWHPILPLSTPHATTDSDVYEGYYIPKGNNIFAGAMTHDEARYPSPFDFLPERFLDAEGNLNQDTVGFAFGFGRRICVGRHIADASLWYAISGMLALFNFSKATDTDGNEIDFEPHWSSGIAMTRRLSHPYPFPFKVTPRRSNITVEDLHSLIFASSS